MAVKKTNFIQVLWDKVDDFVLEFLRIALLGAYGSILPFLLVQLETIKEGDAMLLAVILIVSLKSLDRWLHEKGFAEKGLARF